MANLAFFDVFLEFVQNLYETGLQVSKILPQMIQRATNENLKSGLNDHLRETKEQIKRLEKVFKLLGIQAQTRECLGIAGLIAEGQDIMQRKEITPAVRDCFIIISAQKFAHYEICSYGSACTLVEHMNAACSELADFDEIYELLHTTLHEEAKADIKLTKIAEGKFFKEGVNDELEREIAVMR